MFSRFAKISVKKMHLKKQPLYKFLPLLPVFLGLYTYNMFTVGIFTTHFPYIAFVVFYAFFFLFGVNAPVEEEVQISDSKFKIELQTSKSFADSNIVSNFHYQTEIDFSTHKNFVKSLFKRKINHQCTPITAHWQYCLCNSLFSRPPPSLV